MTKHIAVNWEIFVYKFQIYNFCVQIFLDTSQPSENVRILISTNAWHYWLKVTGYRVGGVVPINFNIQ